MPLYPQNVANQRTYPNSLSFRYFHLGLTIESIKELEGVSPTVYTTHIHLVNVSYYLEPLANLLWMMSTIYKCSFYHVTSNF
jgi:hypothetical protein